jgi:hypothetical protein
LLLILRTRGQFDFATPEAITYSMANRSEYNDLTRFAGIPTGGEELTGEQLYLAG